MTSMVRLKHMRDFGNPMDPTWDNTNGSIWSLIENAVAVICACLPALRPLLNKFLPQLFGTLDSSSKRKSGGERKLEEGSETLGSLEIIGRQKRSAKYTDAYGMRVTQLEETRRSASSFDLGRRETQKGITMDDEMLVGEQVRGI